MNSTMWKNPRDYQYLFLDMNAYFASCEQQAHPNLRDKPVAVTPTLCPSGCVITSSYEARAKKVKTGIMIRDAKKLCPDIVCVQSDTFLYLRYHQKLINIIKNITPFYVVKSVDELVIRLSEKDQNYLSALKFAKIIKSEIKDKLGSYLKCSIGIAPNAYLSKTTAEYKKPDGLTILKTKQIPALLSKLKLTDLCGINYRMEIRLKALGIHTPLEFYQESAQNLKRKLGIAGEYWYLNLHGIDALRNRPIFIPKTIGQSHVLEPRFRKWNLSWPVCQKLIYKAALRLREKKLVTRKIMLYIRFYGDRRYKRWIKIISSSDSIEICRQFKNLWDQAPKFDNFPLKIGIVLFDLKQDIYHQISLFDKCEKNSRLFVSIDRLNQIYSRNKIEPANLFSVRESAPERISFGSPNI